MIYLRKKKPAAAGGLVTVAQAVAGYSNSVQHSSAETAAFSVSAVANRMLVAAVPLVAVGASQDVSGIAATWGASDREVGAGQAMTLIASLNLGGGTSSRPRTAIFALPAPGSGAGTVRLTVSPNDSGGTLIDLLELTGVDQNLANAKVGAATASGSALTSREVALADVAAGSALVGAWAVQSGDYSSEFVASSGSLLTGATGSSTFSDVSGAVLHEQLPTGGAISRTVSWDTANLVAACMVAFPPAP